MFCKVFTTYAVKRLYPPWFATPPPLPRHSPTFLTFHTPNARNMQSCINKGEKLKEAVKQHKKNVRLAAQLNAVEVKKQRKEEQRRKSVAMREVKAYHKKQLDTLTGLRLKLYLQEHGLSLPMATLSPRF